jgi:hypothetical protein
MQKQYGEKQRADLQQVASALMGTPEQKTAFQADNPFGEDLGNLQTVTPAQPGNRQAALAMALKSSNPMLQQFALQESMKDPTASQTSEMRNWQFAQGLPEDQRTQFLGASKTTPSNIQEWNAFQNMNPQQQEQYLRMKRADQIMNLGGTQAVRGQMGGIREEYRVTPKPEEMPGFKAAQASAVEQAKTDVGTQAESAKKVRTADQLISNIGEAENILKQGKATGSLIGSGIARAKGAIGKSDESTQANRQLQLISGWMVANVPRMEGPQSNFDVQNYREMAATVGDSTIPVADRLAALKQLRSLQNKYKTIQGGGRPSLDSLWGE